MVGLGGIAKLNDALEFLMAGASAIQVGTAIFAEPGILGRLIDDLAAWMHSNRISSLAQIVGSANPRFKGISARTDDLLTEMLQS